MAAIGRLISKATTLEWSTMRKDFDRSACTFRLVIAYITLSVGGGVAADLFLSGGFRANSVARPLFRRCRSKVLILM